MTVRVCRNCGRGHWRSLFTKLSETPLKVLTVKNVKLNVQNAFELRRINSFTVVFHRF